jgi:ABC-type transport system substrate-binding protein
MGYFNSPGVYSTLYSYYDLACGSPFNMANVCIPAADALFKRARVSADPTQVESLFNQIVALYNAESPLIVVYQDDDVTVLGKNVHSYMASHSWDFRNWGK